MEQIIENGHVTRGYLGIFIQPLTPELAKAFNLPENHGALVASVSPRSPSAKAGLKEGDVITHFNGKPVVDSKQLRLMASQTPPGTRADLRYLRGGKEEQTTVTLGELRGEELAQARGRGGRDSSSGAVRGGFAEGLQVSELDSQTRRQFKIPDEVDGVVVTDVEPGTAADRAGFQPGDVIEEVNRRPVKSLRDATSNLRSESGSILMRVWSGGASHYVVVENSGQPKTKGAAR